MEDFIGAVRIWSARAPTDSLVSVPSKLGVFSLQHMQITVDQILLPHVGEIMDHCHQPSTISATTSRDCGPLLWTVQNLAKWHMSLARLWTVADENTPGRALDRRIICPKGSWSEGFLVRRVVGPKGGSLVRIRYWTTQKIDDLVVIKFETRRGPENTP